MVRRSGESGYAVSSCTWVVMRTELDPIGYGCGIKRFGSAKFLVTREGMKLWLLG